MAKFHSLSFSGYQGCKGCKGCKISYFIVFWISRLRGLQRLQDFRLYHFQDTRISRVAKVAKFQTLSFSGYQGCEGCIGCKISDFIVFRKSKLQRLEDFRLYHSQDIKLARVAKVARFQTIIIIIYRCLYRLLQAFYSKGLTEVPVC